MDILRKNSNLHDAGINQDSSRTLSDLPETNDVSNGNYDELGTKPIYVKRGTSLVRELTIDSTLILYNRDAPKDGE